MESDLSYPMLAYFRSQHDNQSWLAALTTILDACALLKAAFPQKRQRAVKLTYAMCLISPSTWRGCCGRRRSHPRRSGWRPRTRRACALLEESGLTLADEATLTRHLRTLRESYEPYVAALSHRLAMPLPACVPTDEVADDWRVTEWDPRGRVVF